MNIITNGCDKIATEFLVWRHAPPESWPTALELPNSAQQGALNAGPDQQGDEAQYDSSGQQHEINPLLRFG